MYESRIYFKVSKGEKTESLLRTQFRAKEGLKTCGYEKEGNGKF